MRGLNNQSGQAIRIVLVCSGKIVLLWTPTGSPHIRGPTASGRGQGGCGAGPWPSHSAAQCVAMRCVTSEPVLGDENGPMMSHMYSAASSLPPYLYGLYERSVTWVPSGMSSSRLALACTPPGSLSLRALQPTSRCLAFSTQMPRPMSTSTTMAMTSARSRLNVLPPPALTATPAPPAHTPPGHGDRPGWWPAADPSPHAGACGRTPGTCRTACTSPICHTGAVDPHRCMPDAPTTPTNSHGGRGPARPATSARVAHDGFARG